MRQRKAPAAEAEATTSVLAETQKNEGPEALFPLPALILWLVIVGTLMASLAQVAGSGGA